MFPLHTYIYNKCAYIYSFLYMNIDIFFWKIGMIYEMITNFRIMCLWSPNISKNKNVDCEIGLDCNGIW